MENNTHKDHRKRVRAKVMENGFSHLADHELLEKLLFHAIPRGDTNETAHFLLKEFGSLSGVFKADINSLSNVPGVGEKTALYLCTVGEAMRRVQRPGISETKSTFKKKEDLFELVLSVLAGETVEKIYVFCFDGNWKNKRQYLIAEGDELKSDVNLRKIVESAMFSKASKVVLAHNHPIAVSEPSLSDIETTRFVSVTLRKLGVSLVDHVIVGEDLSVYSMQSDPRFSSLFN